MDSIGSRWWKFDFHTHTPVSLDYGKDERTLRDTTTPRAWLMAFVDKGIECVAVTDHNASGWIDKLKVEAELLRLEGYNIYIFPGVEISTHGNIHVLGIFDPSKGDDDITRLMGAVEFHGTPGDSDAVTEDSPQQVLEKIIKRGGVAIPAHIDRGAGLCTAYSSHTLKQNLEHATAVEIIFRHEQYEEIEAKSSPLQSYKLLKLGLSEVLGSDAHKPSAIGTGFTWVKMCNPTIDGLKLALLDGDVSIKRSDLYPDNPNIYATNRIKKLLISKTKYCGRVNTFEIPFHPWLNCIIGGRGSGKSSVLEFMRIGLGRDKELVNHSNNSEIKNTFEKFAKKPRYRDDDGVFLDDSSITLVYYKDETEYKLTWEFQHGNILIERSIGDDQWVVEDGDVINRFPVRIFSQKQIYDIAKNPNSLLNIIDSTSNVNKLLWQSEWNDAKFKFLQLRTKQREIKTKVNQKSIISGQLLDINRKISLIERSGHAKILIGFLSATNKDTAINEFLLTLSNSLTILKECHDSIILNPLNPDGFVLDDPKDISFIEQANKLFLEIEEVKGNISSWIEHGNITLNEFKEWYSTSETGNQISNNKKIYNEHVEKLRVGGVNNPGEYQLLVSQRKELEQKIKEIEVFEKELNNIEIGVRESYSSLVNIRVELTNKRKKFIDMILRDNKLINVTIESFCDVQYLDSSFRKVIGKDDGVFSNDIFINDDEKNFGILNELNKILKEKSSDINASINTINLFKKEFCLK
ncbi:TPA: TrlF family AAA-like ATPase, partial [Yersinia enterocolitica]